MFFVIEKNIIKIQRQFVAYVVQPAVFISAGRNILQVNVPLFHYILKRKKYDKSKV